MILRSFKSVGWVAGIGAAALGCYMLSLKVASERAELAAVESRIVVAQRAIRDLQTELGTRGRLQQLEHWNAEVLALSAPVAVQFVENELVLARFETQGASGAGVEAPVRMASIEAAPQPTPHAEAPAAARRAVAPAAEQPAAAQPVVRRASLTTPAAAPAARPPRSAATRATTADAQPIRIAARQPAPVRTASLLDERTTRALSAAARAERGRPSAAARNRQEAARD